MDEPHHFNRYGLSHAKCLMVYYMVKHTICQGLFEIVHNPRNGTSATLIIVFGVTNFISLAQY